MVTVSFDGGNHRGTDRHTMAVVHMLSILLLTLGSAMLLPALSALSMQESDWTAFGAASATTLLVAGTLYLMSRDAPLILRRREAFLLTTSAWVVSSAFAALPFIYVDIPGVDYTEAFFEAVSGLTTTGSTVFTNLDAMPHGILLWRGMLQWLGGIGIIVMAVAILPFLRVGGMQLFRTESSERSTEINLRAAIFAKLILACYLLLTFLCALVYWLGGMTGFEATVHAMTTVSTGGYSTSDRSIGNWSSPIVQWGAVVFMTAGALPFLLYVQFLKGRPLALLWDVQVRVLLALLVIVVTFTALRLWTSDTHYGLIEAFTLAALNVVSIVTTTGYASVDYQLWGNWAVLMFFFLMFLGGCSGSTSGAIKTYRLQVLAAATGVQMKRLLYPNGIFTLHLGHRQVEEETIKSIAAFVIIFFASCALTTLALSLLGLDLLTSLSAAATALTNVGPGLGDTIGPAGNFAPLPDPAKWILSAAMLLGRLELFTVLVLVLPAFWRD